MDMNFNELQKQWQNEEVKVPLFSLEQQNKVNHPLTKIRKNMKMEFWSNLMTFVFILIFLFTLENVRTITYAIILTITAILVTGIYGIKFFVFYKEISGLGYNTKNALQYLMHQFELQKQHYTSYYIAFIPIIVCSYIILFEYLPFYQHQSDYIFIVFFSLTVLLGLIFLYVLGNWWFHFFYGKYIQQIEEILEELQ